MEQVNGGWAPLHYACSIGNLAACKSLLDEGSDVAQRAVRVPLLRLVCNHDKVVLVQHEGQNCLHLAARFGHMAVVELILVAGLDVDSADQVRRSRWSWP